MSFLCHSQVPVYHLYFTRVYSYVIRMSLVCTRMSLVCTRIPSACHSCVLVCYSYVTIYCIPLCYHLLYTILCYYLLYTIRMSLVFTRMLFLCHSYVICMSLGCIRMPSVCHSCVVLPWTCISGARIVKLRNNWHYKKLSNTLPIGRYSKEFLIQ